MIRSSVICADSLCVIGISILQGNYYFLKKITGNNFTGNLKCTGKIITGKLFFSKNVKGLGYREIPHKMIFPVKIEFPGKKSIPCSVKKLPMVFM